MKENIFESPLGEKVAERIKGRTGRPLDRLTMEAIRRGDLRPEDFMIDAETLGRQAEVAEVPGYRQVGQNLRRAAELAALSNEELLSLYNALRPYRSSYQELVALAHELQIKYGAEETARLVGEAAQVYLAMTFVETSEKLTSMTAQAATKRGIDSPHETMTALPYYSLQPTGSSFWSPKCLQGLWKATSMGPSIPLS